MSHASGILLTGHLPWSDEKQTPHYIAESLAQAATILYIEPPIAWHPETPSFSWRRCAAVFQPGLRLIRANIWTYTPVAVPFGRYQSAGSINRMLFRSGLGKAVERLGFSDPILWLAETDSSPCVVDMYPHAPAIFHAIDYFTPDHQARAAAALGSHADLTLASSPSIAATFSTPSYVFRNGWDFPSLTQADSCIPDEVMSIRPPRLGFVGYFNPNLDYNLLYRLVETLSVSLVMIGRQIGALGADEALLKKLLRHPSVYYLGERTTSALPAYLNGFDLCLAPYKKTPRIYASDPLKVYQYLAYGKPVVSTPVKVLEPLPPLVRIAQTTEEFINAVEDELRCCDDPLLSERRKTFAETTRWPNRWRELLPVFSNRLRLAPLADICRSLTLSEPQTIR